MNIGNWLNALGTQKALCLACSILALSATTGRAADLPSLAQQPLPPSVTSSWESTAVMYLWATGLRGDLATLPPLPSVSVNIGFDKVLQHLDGGIMGAGEIRNGRFLVDFDILYAKLGASVNPRGPLFNSAKMNTSSFIGTLVGGYRIVEGPSYSLDVLAGIRGYSVWTQLSTTSFVPALNLINSHTESWVDPIIGVKGRVALNEKFFLTSWGFLGGFGVASKSSWDAMGGVGYVISKDMSAIVGYRALGVDYQRNGFIYNIVQSGPIVALTYKF